MTFDQIAEFTLGPVAAPESTMEMASTLLIDTLGVAAGASPLEVTRIARDHACRFHGAGDPVDSATLLFDGRKASLPGVAFAVASQIDNLDAHDGYNPTKGHIGCAVVPALCALAEQQLDLSARDALEAMVMAYEFSARAAIALHATVEDYHTSGAWNALGVAALICRLRGYDKKHLRHALGIAEYHGPRSQMMREIANPTMLHDGSGMGAMVGCMAALMARDGFQGAPAITIEAQDVAHIWADLGCDWTILKNYIKPYPICRWAHAAIDALDALATTNELTENNVTGIEVRTFEESAALFPGMPETTSQAQYSLAFALAVRLVHGTISPSHISGDGLKDQRVAAVIDKITVIEDARHSDRFPLGRWSDITVRTTDGAVLTSGDVHAKGGPEAPMDMTQVEAKFHDMASVLDASRRSAIWAMRDKMLQPETKFSELVSLLHPAVDQ